MNEIFTKAYAKINLALIIEGKRENGYHDLDSIFQIIDLHDEIRIEKLEKENDISIISNVEALQKNNIIEKAFHKMKEKYPQISGVKVTLNKIIPSQAGLGGGSADCASFILAMNELFSLDMTREEMETLGASIGADVVPCMRQGTTRCTGIGDKATYIKDNTNYDIVIIKPDVACDTKVMFETFDNMNITEQKNTISEMMQGLEENDIKKIADAMYNVFEELVHDNEEILVAKEKLSKLGADGVLMTGSGSAVYGIFEHHETAKQAYDSLKDTDKAYLCKTYKKKNN